MDFAEADALCDRITDFLAACGGPYEDLKGEVEANVLHALATGQYVMKEDAGEILYFASYWRVHPHEVATTAQRITPTDVINGSVCYITEAAVKQGYNGMRKMIADLRRKTKGKTEGVFWHRPAKEDRVYLYPRQGGEHGK